MFNDIIIPESFLPLIIFKYLFCCYSKESSSSNSWVKNLDFMIHISFCQIIICQPIFYFQCLSENCIYTLYNKPNNLNRSVPHTIFISDFRIICFQEILIEMNERVFSIITKNFPHVCNLKQ